MMSEGVQQAGASRGKKDVHVALASPLLGSPRTTSSIVVSKSLFFPCVCCG